MVQGYISYNGVYHERFCLDDVRHRQCGHQQWLLLTMGITCNGVMDNKATDDGAANNGVLGNGFVDDGALDDGVANSGAADNARWQ